MQAGQVFKVYIVYMLIGIITMGLCDFHLWYMGRQTVSEWLRQNSEWYFYSLAVAVLFFVLLFIHLFARGHSPPS